MGAFSTSGRASGSAARARDSLDGARSHLRAIASPPFDPEVPPRKRLRSPTLGSL